MKNMSLSTEKHDYVFSVCTIYPPPGTRRAKLTCTFFEEIMRERVRNNEKLIQWMKNTGVMCTSERKNGIKCGITKDVRDDVCGGFPGGSEVKVYACNTCKMMMFVG